MRRMRLVSLLGFGMLALLVITPAAAVEGPAHTATANLTLNDVQYGDQAKLIQLGRLVFTTPFNEYDGLGDGDFDASEEPNYLPGHRPTLQNDGTPFLRINGLDAQSCNECHVIVSHETRPPTLGIAGVGGIVNQAIIRPTMADVADMEDDRVIYRGGHEPDLPMMHDGVADYNGRFANPPFLFGSGGVELLAKEMTAELQAKYLDAYNGRVGNLTPLTAKGVYFGYARTVGYQQVELHLQGVGPIEVDENHPETALVVAPFGRKGENFSVRDFDRGATQFHFGIQPVEVVGAGIDDDQDDLADEISEAEMGVLHMFGVSNPPPVQQSLSWQAAHGFVLFNLIGCSACHRPLMRTNSRSLPLAHPEVATDPYENVYRKLDLVQLGFTPDPFGKGVLVPLFSDLKRHDMGPGLAESLEFGGGGIPYSPIDIPNEDFITARLWGIADTAPYLHDGRAPTLHQAIEAHGGEAQIPRNLFVNTLSQTDRDHLIAFLMSLRTPGVISPVLLAKTPVE